MPADRVLKNANDVLSPGLLFYLDRIEHNLRTAIRIAGGPERLRPHVKTHKTPQIAKLMLTAGITRHKAATIAEAEMLAQAGAPDVLLAYPVVGPNVGRLVTLIERYPQTRFSCLVDDIEPARLLAGALAERGLGLDVWIDLNVGMGRTGTDPGERAAKLLADLEALPALRPIGLSAYDGHNTASRLEERRGVAEAFWGRILEMRARLERIAPVPRLVLGGTPSFTIHASRDLPGLELSPGTFILHDGNYGPERYPDLGDFQPAALLLTRVISRPGGDRVTFDLGHKAVAADPGPVASRLRLVGMPDATPVAQSEEHLVVTTPNADRFRPGDVAYALPAHVCPTVALHEFAYVVRDCEVIDRWQIVARRRVITV